MMVLLILCCLEAAAAGQMSEYKADWTTADEQVLTTSSMMGSGFAASSWSLSLSSTANKLVTISQQRATAKEKRRHWRCAWEFFLSQKVVDD